MEKAYQNLSGVSETLLIPMYTRAQETQRSDAMIKDKKAVELVSKIDYDFKRIKLQGHDQVSLILRVREFDRFACAFLARHPQAVVVHIGCGLDTRFERVDNGQVEWFDLDLPEVIELRRKLIGGEGQRYHLLGCSAFETTWFASLSSYQQRPFLFITEAVLPYFEEKQVKSLVLALLERFPGSELVLDGHTPFIVRMDNLHLAFYRVKARLQWGLKHAKDVESWGEGIRLLEEWFYFDTPEPRMRPYRWMYYFPLLGKSTGIFHYRLGKE